MRQLNKVRATQKFLSEIIRETNNTCAQARDRIYMTERMLNRVGVMITENSYALNKELYKMTAKIEKISTSLTKVCVHIYLSCITQLHLFDFDIHLRISL